jgi:ribonuclease BN (tRNA processing enzyme)
MEYRIISTGSKGNAVILNDEILIDCGVPYKSIKPYVKGLKLVLLTHIHSDHFKPETIRKLANERPTLRFGCGKWLLSSVIACGVRKTKIDIYIPNTKNQYTDDLQLIMIPLKHNVSNCGYKIYLKGEKVFYATDCNNLDGIDAPGYDYYMIEANYEDEEIWERIRQKEETGQYCYEYQVLNNHLSKKKADEFIIANAESNSRFVYLHGHGGVNFEV